MTNRQGFAARCSWLVAASRRTEHGAARATETGDCGGGSGDEDVRFSRKKSILAWADTRNGISQHGSVSHALAIIERLGYESGLWDTHIRTDSHMASYQPLMTTGEPASGGPGFGNVEAVAGK
jgi:hypothetical protein